jgi:hypothetical protein
LQGPIPELQKESPARLPRKGHPENPEPLRQL